MKKHLAIALTASSLAFGSAAAVGVTQSNANAAENTTKTSQSSDAKTDPMSNLVDALVKKFNLKKADVQAVFDEQHTAMQAERETQTKTEVAQLVKDSKLTQAQADKINAKRAEIQKEMEANRGKTTRPTDSEMQTKRTELDKWLTDNGISTDYHYLLMGGRGHRGPDGPGGNRDSRKANQTSPSTPSTAESTGDTSTN
ncbi:MAG: hypothetical protein QG629_141 [Patescibacteria group bacterium]|nr:hypothetical protein [Candidatus Saccharibacteria bacterium]MDQ5963059.1 hypothetical protein [Patescibacteria group bacterium]